MIPNYDAYFQSIVQGIREYCPKTSQLLEQISNTYGTEAGYYAAVAVIWLKGHLEFYGRRSNTDFVDVDVQSFTYFQRMHSEPEAIAIFQTIIQTYLTEKHATTA